VPKLWQVTKLIRSKNAGPFELTFDVIFKDRESSRPAISGDVDDTDVFGGQQHGPLVDLDVP
jgi:hypothetical protein